MATGTIARNREPQFNTSKVKSAFCQCSVIGYERELNVSLAHFEPTSALKTTTFDQLSDPLQDTGRHANFDPLQRAV